MGLSPGRPRTPHLPNDYKPITMEFFSYAIFGHHMNLLPRDDTFYAFFLKQVELISLASKVLMEGVRVGNSRLAGAATEISVLESRGDEVIHGIFKRLNQTFITPLDPEDIHNIASALDDVLDGIEDTAHRLVSYNIEPVPRDMVELATIVNACAVAAKSAIQAFEHKGPILEHCIEINRLENEADLISRSAVADLFHKQKDPITLIKLKEVYEFFEDTIDRFEDVADVLQNVAVKNS
jgi:predicted phosphate transport protein (TIGR00153 family)